MFSPLDLMAWAFAWVCVVAAIVFTIIVVGGFVRVAQNRRAARKTTTIVQGRERK